MKLETMLGSLNREEKLVAMDLLWRDLSEDPSSYPSPEWHGQVLAERMANPAEGPSLGLAEARAEIDRSST